MTMPWPQLSTDPRGAVFIAPEPWTDMTAWHNTVAELRQEAPLLRVEAEGWNPFYAVLRHGDVTEISRRNDIFWSSERSAPSPDSTFELLAALGIDPPATLVHLQGDVHKKYREVTNEWFKPAAVRNLQPIITEIADEFADRLQSFDGRCDFASDIAVPFTLRVIMGIFGVPKEDESLMLQLTQGLFGAGDPEYLGDFSDPTELVGSTLNKFSDYFDAITEDRRAHPTTDLATVIANGEVDGEYMDPAMRLWYYIIVATAGHDTTSYGLSGGLEALLQNPEQLAKLRQDPDKIMDATEEMLRWTSPVRSFFRFTQEDISLESGVEFAAGDVVLTSYPSANRDESVFDDSMRFDIERPDLHRILTFGMGVHHCLGAMVARREIRTMLEKVFDRVSSIELDGEPQWTASHFVSGVKHLPIAYTLK